MKKVTLALSLMLACITAFAQQTEFSEENGAEKGTMKEKGSTPVIYLSTSTGFNNATGIVGVSFDIPVANYISIETGMGASTWGNKFYLGGKYYLRPAYHGLAFAFGVSRYRGDNDARRNMETIYGNNDQVSLRLSPQTNILLAVYRYGRLGRRGNRFFTGVGWSERISGNGWQQTQGPRLTDHSVDQVNSWNPGGPMLCAGFSFGFYRSARQ